MMNNDLILEILSYCSASTIGKFRLLNKACNKRSYELSFIKRHLHRTNSFFGYFIQDKDSLKSRSGFLSCVGKDEDTRISLLLNNAEIVACDTHHGILLCVDRMIPDYIVCKPATKQYQIIPNPITRYRTMHSKMWFRNHLAIGIMVISLCPLRYKIIRVSSSRKRVRKEGFHKFNCEVFDSDVFAWKRLNDLELPEYFLVKSEPVSAYGCLHWLTLEMNVIRFCMQTETWSIIPLPDEVIDALSSNLVSYEGKLGVIHSRWSHGGNDLWVLEKSFGKFWVKVKDVKIEALQFLSNDVVSMMSCDQLDLYNNKLRLVHKFPSCDWFRRSCIPFYSNFDRFALKKKLIMKESNERRKT